MPPFSQTTNYMELRNQTNFIYPEISNSLSFLPSPKLSSLLFCISQMVFSFIWQKYKHLPGILFSLSHFIKIPKSCSLYILKIGPFLGIATVTTLDWASTYSWLLKQTQIWPLSKQLSRVICLNAYQIVSLLCLSVYQLFSYTLRMYSKFQNLKALQNLSFIFLCCLI